MTTRNRTSLRFATSLALCTIGAVTLWGCGAGTPGLSQNGTATGRTGSASDPVATGNRKAAGEVGRMGLYLSVTPGPYRAKAAKAVAAKTAKTDTDTSAPRPEPSPIAVANVAAQIASTASLTTSMPDHLWATVLKVELIGSDEKAVTVFDNPDGATIDLAALDGSDGKGRRFVPLACAAPPAGQAYNRARVTLGKAFLKFEKGAKAATTMPIADDLPRDNEGRPVVSFPLTKGRQLGSGKENLVVDVDLSQTNLSGERISPALREGERDGLLDAARQEAVAFTGTVSEVTAKAGETVFALSLPGNKTLMVQAGDQTAFFADGTEKNATLKDGALVQVRGTLAPDTKRLVASDVRVYAGEQKPAADAATVRGRIVGHNAAKNTLTVAVQQVENFQPTQSTVTVELPKEATLRSTGGLLLSASEFNEQVTQAASSPSILVSVEGAMEAATGTLTASRARLVSTKLPQAHEAEVVGLVKDASVQDRKLIVESPTEWQGFVPLAGTTGIAVVADGKATYQGEDGKTLSATDFWAAAAEKPYAVRAMGLYSGGKLTATRLALAPAPARPALETQASNSDVKTDATSVKAEKTEKTEAAKVEKAGEETTSKPDVKTEPAKETPKQTTPPSVVNG